MKIFEKVLVLLLLIPLIATVEATTDSEYATKQSSPNEPATTESESPTEKNCRKVNQATCNTLNQFNTLLDWAIVFWPDILTGGTSTFEIEGFFARHFETRNFYVGTKDGQLYGYGYGNVFTGLVDLGPLNNWLDKMTDAKPELIVVANNFSPFQPIEITARGISSYSDKKWSIYFNNEKLASPAINFETEVISVLAPYTNGDITVRIASEDGLTSNAVTIHINQPELPQGVTIEETEEKIKNYIDQIIINMQESAGEQLTTEQQNTLLTLAQETTAVKELLSFFMSELSSEEQELFAVFINNTKLFEDTAITPKSSPIAQGPRPRARFRSTWVYDHILSNRKIAIRNSKYSTILDFGYAGIITAFSGPINVLLSMVDISLALEKATMGRASVLKDFKLEIPLLPEGIYRDELPLATTFTGTFIGIYPPTEAFSRMFTDLAWSVADLTPLARTNLRKKISKSGDSLITSTVKEMLDSTFDVESTKNEIGAIFNKLQNVNTLEGIEFDINDFQKLILYPNGSQARVSWSDENSEIEVKEPGGVKLIFTIFDELRPEDDKTTSNTLEFEILNHFPELLSTPICTVDNNGQCAFKLKLTDKDDEFDTLWTELSSEPSFGQISTSSEGVFTYSYLGFGSPIAENISDSVKAGESVVLTLKGYRAGVETNDKLTIDYGDPWEFDTTEIIVDLSAVDLEEIKYEIVSRPTKGNLNEGLLNINGQLKYTANKGVEGKDTFTYRVIENGFSSKTATVTISFDECISGKSEQISCSIPNGVGTHTRLCNIEGTWNDYAACKVSQCDIGYKQSGDQCKKEGNVNEFPNKLTILQLSTPLWSYNTKNNGTVVGYYVNDTVRFTSSFKMAYSYRWDYGYNTGTFVKGADSFTVDLHFGEELRLKISDGKGGQMRAENYFTIIALSPEPEYKNNFCIVTKFDAGHTKERRCFWDKAKTQIHLHETYHFKSGTQGGLSRQYYYNIEGNIILWRQWHKNGNLKLLNNPAPEDPRDLNKNITIRCTEGGILESINNESIYLGQRCFQPSNMGHP